MATGYSQIEKVTVEKRIFHLSLDEDEYKVLLNLLVTGIIDSEKDDAILVKIRECLEVFKVTDE